MAIVDGPVDNLLAFGRWLLARPKRGDWLDELVAGAKADRAFPRDGDPETVRKHLGKVGADGDMFDRLDDAEREWAAA